MLILAFLALALVLSVVTSIVFGLIFINTLMLLGLHAFAAIFTAKRARDIPLYWIIAVFGALALCFVEMFAWHPIVVPESTDTSATGALLAWSGLAYTLSYWQLWTNSWPVLAGMAIAIVSIGMSYSSRPLLRALAGVTWGAAAMTIFSWIYHPVV